MCGIVGMIQSSSRGFDYMAKDAFVPMLLLNSMRGLHSTGLFGVEVQSRGDKKVDKIAWMKKIGSPYNLMQELEFNKFQSRIYSDFHAVIGHGRYATAGQINAHNAHPFTEGSVTLVHNGTLRNLWDFKIKEDGKEVSAERYFDVDSNAAAFFLDRWEADDFFKKVRGAFSFVWYDRRTKEMYAARNSERPLFMVERGGNFPGLFLSSEKETFQYLRAKWPGLELKDAIEIEPSTLYTFPIGTAEKPTWTTRPLKFIEATPVHHHKTAHAGDDDTFGWYQWMEDNRSHQRAAKSKLQGSSSLKYDPDTETYVPDTQGATVHNIRSSFERKAKNTPGRITSYTVGEYQFNLQDYVIFYVCGYDPLNNTPNSGVPDEHKWWSVKGIAASEQKVETVCYYQGLPEILDKEIMLAGRISTINYLRTSENKVESVLRLTIDQNSLVPVPEEVVDKLMNNEHVEHPNKLFAASAPPEEDKANDGAFLRLKNGDRISIHRFEKVAKKGCARCLKQIDITDAIGCLTLADAEATGRPVSPVEKAHNGFYCPDCVIGGFAH